MGNFGALSNPSSFHNPFARILRLNLYKKCIKPLVRELNRLENNRGEVEDKEEEEKSKEDERVNIKDRIGGRKGERKVEMLFDRMCIRKEGCSISAEQWHIDNGETSPDIDIFGGWVNLDIRSQFFSCVKGSHLDSSRDRIGFTGFTAEEKENFTSTRTRVEIPPGHWIAFYQYLIHEIVSTKIKYESIRMYTGFRLSPAITEDSYYGNRELEEIFNKQSVPKLPGGDKAPMYAQNHIRFHRQNAVRFSEQFKEECLEPNGLVSRYMTSLEEYGFPLYEEYEEKEKTIYRPHFV